MLKLQSQNREKMQSDLMASGPLREGEIFAEGQNRNGALTPKFDVKQSKQ